MNRAEQAATYCSALLGGPEGDDRLAGLYATVWTAGDKLTRWRPADKPGAVASLIAELDADPSTAAVYMCTTLHDKERNCDNLHDGKHLHDGHCRYRPGKAESAGLISVWLDIDLAGEGHAGEHYPATMADARRVLDELRLPPTLIVQSGGGIHVYWVLTEPWLVRDAVDQDAERQAMMDLVKNWTNAAQYHANRLGRWKIDSTFDLARLLRPAGTTNRKIPGAPQPVIVLHHDPDVTYNPSDLTDVLPDATILAAYGAPTGISSAALGESEREILREVNLGALWARVNSADYKGLDYTPEWLADILQLAEETEPGGALVRTWFGERDEGEKGFKGDQNRYDAALMRLLADIDVDTESLIEALMCRRLRAGATTDKVNPARRIDYIIRTVAKFQLTAAHATELRTRTEDRVTAAANLRLNIPEPPAPVLTVVGDEPDEQDFLTYTDALLEHEPQTEEQKRDIADAKVVRDHTKRDKPERPAPESAPDYFSLTRHELEISALDQLTELLIPEAYRKRGVSVWSVEYRDHGEQQKGRLLLRLPLDFTWPVSRPARYRPGRPLTTDWWRRDLFEAPRGFRSAVERDCMIATRRDVPKNDWAECIHSLITVWRRDSTGADLATFAVEWLFEYLMMHHGTGQIAEVQANGRPWVRKPNGWNPADPPVIYIDRNQFLEHCRRQPGAVAGRAIKDVLDNLKLTPRRPRLDTGERPTWHEIDPEQFSEDEWRSIVQVTQHAYEVSESKHLRMIKGSGK